MTAAISDWAVALRLARRDLAGGLAGFRLMLAGLVLGVAAIAGVGSMSQSVLAGLRAEGTRLLGGDVDLRLSHRPATPEQGDYLRGASTALSRITEMRAMARAGGAGDGSAERSLVEIKAVDAGYPLVGRVVLDPPQTLAAALGPKGQVWGAVADPNLLQRLGVAIGGKIRLGEAVVEVRAAIVREPDRVASLFQLGPRLIVAEGLLPATGLVRPGSQHHYHYRVLLEPGQSFAAWTGDLKRKFPQAGWRIRGADRASPGTARFIERMSLFLGFVGLTVLLVGGLGVANATTAYLEGKTATIATMKCLGASASMIVRIYFLQVLAAALIGVAVGLAAGALLPLLGARALAGLLPVTPVVGLYADPLAVAAVFGLLVALTFALWPLARSAEVRPGDLFRARVVPLGGRPRTVYAVAAAMGVAVLAGLAVATAGDRGFALWFVGGAAATLAALRAGGWALGRAARLGTSRGTPLSTPPGPTWRLALANLHRPGSTAPGVVLALGVGISVLVAVTLIQGNLDRLLNERLPEEAPAYFFIDIQPDQVRPFADVVGSVPGAAGLRHVPSLRGRIVKIAGEPVEQRRIDPDSAWAVRGDRALTYATAKPPDADIVAGAWWSPDYAGPPLISLDAGLGRGFGVGVGDSLTFNVLGREIETRIASLREIDWRSLRFDFAVIFSPGTLEAAPQTHIAAVRAPRYAEETLERAVTDRFPNVSAIRVREALESAATLLAGIGGAVRVTALVTVVAGILVVAGAVAATQGRRTYDSVVFKVLGATRGRLIRAYLLEYGVVGIATGLVGALVGTVTAWAVVVHVMRIDWVFLPVQAASTAVLCLAVTIVVGFAGTWRALGMKAWPLLRNE